MGAAQPQQRPSNEVPRARWRLDAAATLAREAWDLNGSHEWLGGAIGGVDLRVWRGVSLRSELQALRVAQDGADAWLRGWTIGTRLRGHQPTLRPLVDVAVGLSHATTAVPAGGTRFNYLALIGAGVEAPFGAARLAVTGRWLHASNNGREGHARNPDIQSLGLVIGVGWEY